VLDPRHGFKAAGAQLHADEAGRVLLVALPHGATAPQIRDAVQAWLMRQARRIFSERLDHFAPRLGVQWRKLSLSSAGTLLGQRPMRADGSIRLNWRLVHFGMPVIDYVVAHELSAPAGDEPQRRASGKQSPPWCPTTPRCASNSSASRFRTGSASTDARWHRIGKRRNRPAGEAVMAGDSSRLRSVSGPADFRP
jgi:hypothetical protein